MRCHPWSCALVLLFGSGCLASENVPTAENFYRRIHARAAVLGNYLYVDGGEMSEKGLSDDWPWRPVNTTLSLDLTKSWSPKDVEYIETKKPSSVPRLTRNGFFHDDDKKTFTIWGGRISHGSPGEPPPVKTWKFTADGKGGGAWSTEATTSSFSNLVRSEDGGYVSTKDAGFWIGGTAFPETSTDAKSDVPGLVSYNFTSGEWTNHTTAPFSDDGTASAPTMTYAPGLGPNGLVVVLGGLEHALPKPAGHLSFDTVHFFDPVTMKWYEQKTTGAKPQKRSQHCSVGVQGNGTYEIFIHGGWNEDYKKILSDMYVLTIPGFYWSKVEFDGKPRTEFDCVVAGNRQMVTVGGAGAFGGWTVPDPFPQGLGIFDLTELKWKDKFDPDAAAYKTPGLVQKFYDEGGLDKVEWSDNVKALLIDKKADSSTSSSSSSGTGSSPSSSSTSTNQGSNSGNTDQNQGGGSSPTNQDPNYTATIAGAAVGGVVGLALIGGLIFLLRRRRRKASGVQELVDHPEASEMEARSVKPDGWTPGSANFPVTSWSGAHSDGYSHSHSPAHSQGWQHSQGHSQAYSHSQTHSSPVMSPGHPPSELASDRVPRSELP